jgi:hypothetical protein
MMEMIEKTLVETTEEEHRVQQVHRVHQDLTGHKVHRVHQELMEPMVSMEQMV